MRPSENHTVFASHNADMIRSQRLQQLVIQREATRKRLHQILWMCRNYRTEIRSLRKKLAWINGNLAEIDDLLVTIPSEAEPHGPTIPGASETAEFACSGHQQARSG